MSAAPTLSILVNNYNYGEYLGMALDHALAQMLPGDELIVVDDGSTDNSHEVLAQYRGRDNVQVILQENQGQMGAVCNAVDVASGDVLLLLDSDDYYLDGYLERLRAIYSEHPEVSFVCARGEPGGDNAEGVQTMARALSRTFYRRGVVGPSRWSAYCFGEFLGVPTTGNSMRRELAERILPYVRNHEFLPPEPPHIARIFRLLGTTNTPQRYTPDGLIVRYASVLEAVKYHDDRPGFFYRIHRSNKFARLSWLDRQYHQFLRSYSLRQKMYAEDLVEQPPTARAIQVEVQARRFPLHRRRRRSMKVRYAWAVLGSKGSVVDKFRALAALPGAGKA